MLAISPSRPLTLLGTCVLLAACSDGVSTLAGPASDSELAMSVGTSHESAVVNWHAQQAGFGRSGPVAGAQAHLVRNANGITYRMTTNSLTPGNAYTLWLVIVNNPSACGSTPCAAPVLFSNLDTDAQVRFAAGSVAGGSGKGTFAGSVSEGPLSGWLADGSLENSMGAEVHLVINDHGPMVPEFMPGMIHTYRGGCSNSSPFPPFFPATALADGEVGPNTCRLYQAAIFTAPLGG